jgi:hypothetical protein
MILENQGLTPDKKPPTFKRSLVVQNIPLLHTTNIGLEHKYVGTIVIGHCLALVRVGVPPCGGASILVEIICFKPKA